MQSRRHLLTAAAVMTLHAMALSAMSPQEAFGHTVNRCVNAQGHVSYQAAPCSASAAERSTAVRVDDTRTEAQVRQALDNRRREGFEQVALVRERPTRGRAKKAKSQASIQSVALTSSAQPPAKPPSKARARQERPRARGAAPVALSSHRFGERPFEHIRTPLSDKSQPTSAPRKISRPRKPNAHFTARVPSPSDQGSVGVHR